MYTMVANIFKFLLKKMTVLGFSLIGYHYQWLYCGRDLI